MEVADRYADQAAREEEFEEIVFRGEFGYLGSRGWVVGAARLRDENVCEVIGQNGLPEVFPDVYSPSQKDIGSQVVANLVREIFGNPIQRVALNTAWLTPTAKSLALTAYEERRLPSGELDCPRLAVLADALEEAGCTEEAVLDHLRGPGPHVRGCWPVDLLLGKE
jgi:hypothetical protein